MKEDEAMPKPIKQVKNPKEYNPGSGATNARNLLENAFREKNKKENSERKQQQLRSSLKEDVLNDKPGTRANIVPGDLNLKKGPTSKKQSQVTRQRNWERWREMGESKERTPSGPAIDIDSAYYQMQKNKRNKKW